MEFPKIPIRVWVYVGGFVALGVVGQVINHIKVNKEPVPKLKIASLNPVFLIINQFSDHENNPENS